MAELPDGMTIIEVRYENFERILELSQNTEKPYSRQDLLDMKHRADAVNHIALVMFMSPKFWEQKFIIQKKESDDS